VRDDQELLEFVVMGRQPFDPESTTGVLMPPRGGNPGLTDDDLLTIIAYVRTLDGFAPDGSGIAVAAAETPESEAAAPVSDEELEYVRPDVSALLASLGVELEAPAPAPDRDGDEIFDAMCGTRYEELISVPPDYCDILLEIAPEMDEDELFTLLQEGSPIWGEDNSTGVHFPARGGYPAMNDAEISSFIDYLNE
jgi:cytochrome c5